MKTEEGRRGDAVLVVMNNCVIYFRAFWQRPRIFAGGENPRAVASVTFLHKTIATQRHSGGWSSLLSVTVITSTALAGLVQVM